MNKYFAFKLIHKIAVTLPRKWSYWIGCRIAGVSYLLKKRLRQAVKANITHILSQTQSRKVTDVEISDKAEGVFKNFAKYLVDFFSFSKFDENNIHGLINMNGVDHMRNAFNKGKGVIGLTAHLGNWELCAVVTSLLGFDVNAVTMSHDNTKINRLFVNQRVAKGVKVIPVGSGAAAYIKILKQNQLIAMAGDRLINDSGIEIMFFNKRAIIPKGPLILSMRTGAPIVMGFMVRTPEDKFNLTFEEKIDPDEFPGDFSMKLQNMAKRVVGLMEKYISQYPSQWFLFYKVWEEK